MHFPALELNPKALKTTSDPDSTETGLVYCFDLIVGTLPSVV